MRSIYFYYGEKKIAGRFIWIENEIRALMKKKFNEELYVTNIDYRYISKCELEPKIN